MNKLNIVVSVMKSGGLDWLVVNCRNHYGARSIKIGRYYDGSISKEELLKREIPTWFLSFVRLLFSLIPVEVCALITREEIEAEHATFAWMNAAY